MEQLIELLRGAARNVELDVLLPTLRQQREEVKEELNQKKLEAAQSEYDASKWANPGFFRRLMGNAAEKQEEALAKLRSARAARDAAAQTLADLDARLEKDTAEFESLKNCLEDYARAKQDFLASADPEDAAQLRDLELDILRPAALTRLRQLRDTLEALRPGMRRDTLTRLDGLRGNKMALLDLADQRSEQLRALLAHLPSEGIALGASLTDPSGYICGATMEAAQLDRVNIAIEQSYRVQKQIKGL